ncbi:MAG: nucleotide exchange factor GrpE [Lachnospiraceae bacterium]|jgi:molecular chaperone GrpE|nr:nucleotide exchange factor GrpE [Lachnospiraceae bacterium]
MKLMNEEMKKDIQETTDQEQEPAGESVNTQEMGTQEEDTDQARCEQAETEESGGADNESEDQEEADAEETETAKAGEETWAEKRAAKKKLKADKKQDALKEKIEELEDRVKRQMAEFENFRKRTDKEKTAMFETGARSVIEKILPVVDNFERGLATVPEEDKGTPFAEGMEMIYKQLLTELEKMEVKPIPAVGEEFDPNFHNAVMQVESEEFESGVIAQELQKGYTYRDSVVRHSMVAVVS